MRRKLLTTLAGLSLVLLASAKMGMAKSTAAEKLSLTEQISTCMGIGCAAGPSLCGYFVGSVWYPCSGGPHWDV